MERTSLWPGFWVKKNKVIFGECNGSHRIHRTIGDAWIHIYGICGFSQVFFGSMVVNEHPQLPGVWPVAVESCIPTSTAAPAPRFPRAPPIYGCSLANKTSEMSKSSRSLWKSGAKMVFCPGTTGTRRFTVRFIKKNKHPVGQSDSAV